MKYCGVVTEGGFEPDTEYQKRRIYSDEVPMATERIYRIQVDHAGKRLLEGGLR